MCTVVVDVGGVNCIDLLDRSGLRRPLLLCLTLHMPDISDFCICQLRELDFELVIVVVPILKCSRDLLLDHAHHLAANTPKIRKNILRYMKIN